MQNRTLMWTKKANSGLSINLGLGLVESELWCCSNVNAKWTGDYSKSSARLLHVFNSKREMAHSLLPKTK